MIRRGRFCDALVSGPRWRLCRAKGGYDPRQRVLAYLGSQEAALLLHEWGFDVTLLGSLTESGSPKVSLDP
jgi:hypothetical protein